MDSIIERIIGDYDKFIADQKSNGVTPVYGTMAVPESDGMCQDTAYELSKRGYSCRLILRLNTWYITKVEYEANSIMTADTKI
jgi:hypothetical protein